MGQPLKLGPLVARAEVDGVGVGVCTDPNRQCGPVHVCRSVPAGVSLGQKWRAAALGASAAARGEGPERYDGYTSETIMLVLLHENSA